MTKKRLRGFFANLLAVIVIIMSLVAMWNVYKQSGLSKVDFAKMCEPYHDKLMSELPADCYWYYNRMRLR